MARGIQPSPQQIIEERQVTLFAATDALVLWDRYEAELLTHLERQLAVEASQNASVRIEKALQIVRRLARGNAIEDSDHAELHDAVRGVA